MCCVRGGQMYYNSTEGASHAGVLAAEVQQRLKDGARGLLTILHAIDVLNKPGAQPCQRCIAS